MRTLVAVLSLVALVGCKKDEAPAGLPEAVRKDVQKAVAEHVPAAPTPTAAAPGFVQKIDCEKLVPAELRTRYFPGATLAQTPQCQGCPEACKFIKGAEDPAAPTLMFDCRDKDRANWFEQASKVLENTGKPAEGVGRLARNQMGFQLMFVPAKYNCVVSVTWMDGKDQLLPLARDLEAALTPQGLGL